jgi:hypothetical protein
VLTLEAHEYVDPEDWSSQRTRHLPPLPAGELIEIPSTVKAVNAGCWACTGADRGDCGQRTGLTWLINVWLRWRNCASYCGRTTDSTGVISLRSQAKSALAMATSSRWSVANAA